MKNDQTIKDVIAYLQLSTMDPKERAMWMLLLPQMQEEEVSKLKTILQKEVNSMTELYLQATQQKSKNG